MGVTHCLNMKVFIALAALVAVSSGAPRYLVIPIEDVDFGNSNLRLPVYRMPGLARQARAAQEDQYQEPSYDAAAAFSFVPWIYIYEPIFSNAYAAPAPAGPDHVDYGAYTGGYGAFGWYTDHPVLLAGH